MADRDPGVSDVFLSLLLGGAIGAALGLLFAPCSGEELRKRLGILLDEFKEKSDHMFEEIGKNAFAKDDPGGPIRPAGFPDKKGRRRSKA